MKQIIIFAGTTEGRLLGEWLSGEGLEVLSCVATEYGSLLVKEGEHLHVRQGRLTREEMAQLFKAETRPLVLDATHPYATEVSRNIQTACQETGCEYLRLIRAACAKEAQAEKDCVTVGSVEEAALYLAGTAGRILVTTGSKELHHFTGIPDYRDRVYARVLASPEVVEHCQGLGFRGQHLICMQGPFSREMNTAMLRQFEVSWLVTKESGKEGGFGEKLAAAREAGAKVVLVGRPPEQDGISVEEGIELLQKRFSIKSAPQSGLHKNVKTAGGTDDAQKETQSREKTELKQSTDQEHEACEKKQQKLPGERCAVLVGIGMGTRENMTKEAWAAFEASDCILGAGRMMEHLGILQKPMLDAYDPDKMLSYIQEHPEYRNIAVALSGDVGFYSNAKRLIAAFDKAGIETKLLPGISSVSCLCSRLRIAWEDVKLVSIHGRKGNLIGAVREYFRTFTLLGGKDNVQTLCEELLCYGLEHVTLYVGERLGYSDERITKGTPGDLKEGSFDGLCAALIENPDYQGGVPSCIPDEAFIRGGAPMTKSEIRCLSVAKLGLRCDSLIYDIGAGTGSVSVEMALQASEGTVWAIEKEEEAARLIGENARRFRVSNVKVVEGAAPEALRELPAPTHAFIGGSSGSLREILALLLQKNPGVRVVINAVTLETIGETAKCLKELPFSQVETVQVQLSKAKALGRYQLMMGQNPVYIFTAQGGER
ncbi:MAG: precorrin-6A reductase [Lachnospiraceae bacterium]|nr:precorrin-6A reductase [Lachnospiraceae bacterium]